MTQPPNHPGDGQGDFPPSEDPYQGGYQQPGYPQQGGFPPPPGGYQQPGGQGYPPPQQPGGYPPPQQSGGYQQPGGQGYPQQPGGQGFPPPQPQPGQGFPPPPGGGFPPPQGGYGAPQYGGAPGGQQPFNIGDGFSWAWNKFAKNAVALIVPILVYIIGISALFALGSYLVMLAVLPGASLDADGYLELTGGGSIGATLGFLLISLLVGIVVYIAEAAYLSGVLDIADGKPVQIGSFFKPRNTAQVVIAALVLSLATSVLSAIPFVGWIGSIAVSFLTIFALPVIVDRGVPWVEGIKQGFQIIQRDAGNSILVALVAYVITLVGACLCGVGLLVAAPVAALFVVYGYRLLSGGQVAPLTQ